MPALTNPSVTSPRQGDRGRASRVSPRNRTGQVYAAQHAEQEARKAAEAQILDIPELKRQSFMAGHDKGYTEGLEHGWDLCIAALVEEGILDADEPDDEDE